MCDIDCIKEYLKDPVLIFLVLLLAGVLAAFIRGVTSYPLGWMVLTVMIGLRVVHLRRQQRKQ
ncbi:MAG: hypothetical protein RBS57_12455 [Desulforhabdus sp.]|jgi:hypothetical protein|nr:hypothetical protein [Desulforhabdus sp.]